MPPDLPTRVADPEYSMVLAPAFPVSISMRHCEDADPNEPCRTSRAGVWRTFRVLGTGESATCMRRSCASCCVVAGEVATCAVSCREISESMLARSRRMPFPACELVAVVDKASKAVAGGDEHEIRQPLPELEPLLCFAALTEQALAILTPLEGQTPVGSRDGVEDDPIEATEVAICAAIKVVTTAALPMPGEAATAAKRRWALHGGGEDLAVRVALEFKVTDDELVPAPVCPGPGRADAPAERPDIRAEPAEGELKPCRKLVSGEVVSLWSSAKLEQGLRADAGPAIRDRGAGPAGEPTRRKPPAGEALAVVRVADGEDSISEAAFAFGRGSGAAAGLPECGRVCRPAVNEGVLLPCLFCSLYVSKTSLDFKPRRCTRGLAYGLLLVAPPRTRSTGCAVFTGVCELGAEDWRRAPGRLGPAPKPRRGVMGACSAAIAASTWPTMPDAPRSGSSKEAG